MLKLKYDVKCGWNQLYIVEKDIEQDISHLVGTWDDGSVLFAKTEKEFYEKYKDRHDLDLIDEFGLWDVLAETDITYYAHEYFEDICMKEKCFPGLYKISNIEIVWTGSEDGQHAESCYTKSPLKTLKASEVMNILDISRNTLSNYVKKGLIKTDPNYTGKQYRYLADSVFALMPQNKRRN